MLNEIKNTTILHISHSMKNSILIFLVLLFFSCQHEPMGKALSYLHRVADTLQIDRSGNILIYTINPNDCITCLNAFKSFDNKLNGNSGSKIYVVAVDRMIERQAIEKQTTYSDLQPQKNKAVLWGRDLFDSINYFGGVNLAMTMVMVYNYQKDSVLYSKPVREITDMHEIGIELEKKIE